MAEADLSGRMQRAAVDRTRPSPHGGSIGLVLLIALLMVAGAAGLLFVERTNAGPYVLGLLAVLAMIGVFLLFALAAGILRLSGREAASPLLKSVVDGAGDGILITDGTGRVLYANSAYLALVDAGADEVRPVERVFIGNPDVSEAVYRLLKAAREGRRLQEEVRVTGQHGERARWLRMRVRPLGEGKEARLTVWTLADVTRDLERQENVFQELQNAIDYLDHAPAGFFSVDAGGDVGYLNATLAEWLDHDLAQVGSGGLKLTDIVAGEGAALLTTLAGAPGEVKTEVLDIDLKTRGGRTVPARLFHKVAFGADGMPGASRTLVLNRARDQGRDPQRAAEVRFMRFFHNTPMAIATVDRDGRIVRSNAMFARLFHPVLKGDGAAADRSILGVVAEPDRPALEGAIRKAADKQGEIGPVDTALQGVRDGYARFYVTAVEEEVGDSEAAIVYDAEEPGEPVHPVAEDGACGQARRRHRPRLQQRARRHHDGHRFPGERAQADRSFVPGHHADPAERQPGGQPGAPPARLLAQADLAPAGARSRRGAVRPDHAAAPPDRRERHAQCRARARPVAGQGRHRPVRAGDHQPRGQCARRHAERRQAHAAHRQYRRRGERALSVQGHAGG
jgi:two-component system cell cycle sensor histidine kinase/response regulator CckA